MKVTLTVIKSVTNESYTNCYQASHKLLSSQSQMKVTLTAINQVTNESYTNC